jgi:hypothetical protein
MAQPSRTCHRFVQPQSTVDEPRLPIRIDGAQLSDSMRPAIDCPCGGKSIGAQPSGGIGHRVGGLSSDLIDLVYASTPAAFNSISVLRLSKGLAGAPSGRLLALEVRFRIDCSPSLRDAATWATGVVPRVCGGDGRSGKVRDQRAPRAALQCARVLLD